ncbi:hypothetical protein B0H15DRAFT_947302 [Mycena belliarum]|uniref:Uncharacterized protein n=1 Tax=Mycena belliarum TaxID=1033014 RepID=A0AAD6UAY2_9AGAR|nr:hypothetical protein B0H15DRAFT_947302 [Mycena belliae]
MRMHNSSRRRETAGPDASAALTARSSGAPRTPEEKEDVGKGKEVTLRLVVSVRGAFGCLTRRRAYTDVRVAQGRAIFGSPSPQPSAFGSTVVSPDVAAKAKLAAEVLEEPNQHVFGEGGAPLPPAASADTPTGQRKEGKAVRRPRTDV